MSVVVEPVVCGGPGGNKPSYQWSAVNEPAEVSADGESTCSELCTVRPVGELRVQGRSIFSWAVMWRDVKGTVWAEGCWKLSAEEEEEMLEAVKSVQREEKINVEMEKNMNAALFDAQAEVETAEAKWHLITGERGRMKRRFNFTQGLIDGTRVAAWKSLRCHSKWRCGREISAAEKSLEMKAAWVSWIIFIFVHV